MKKIALLTAAVLCLAVSSAFANPAQIRELRNEIAAIRAEMAACQAQREAKVAKRGDKLDLNFSFTTVLQGTQRELWGDSSRNMANYRLDITAERQLGRRGRAFAWFEIGEGTGLGGNLSNINLTSAPNNGVVQVRELWYEHKLCCEKVAVTFGKIDPALHFDGNAVANNEVTQFLNSSFVNNTAIGFNEPNLGVMLAISPASWLTVSGGYFVSDSGKVGMQFDRQLFGIAQANFTPFANGNYRLIAWSNTAEDTALLSGRPQEGYGFALSFDQQVVNNVTLFARYGWAQQEFFSVESAVSGGVLLGGNIWNRSDDKLGLAIGRTWLSNDFSPDAVKRAESNAELFYSVNITNTFTLTPSLQYINTPDLMGLEGNFDAFMYGVRANVRF